MGAATWLRRAVRPICFTLAYVLVAKATEGLTTDNGFTAWYPPAGMVLAYLILVGPRGASTVLVARLVNAAVVVPEAWQDEPDGVIARALAITACYVVGAEVLRRVDLRDIRLAALAWFALVGLVAVPLGAAASVAAVSVLLLGETATDAFSQARTVWIGDAVAIATVVPAVVTVVTTWQARRPLIVRPQSRRAAIALGAQVVGLIVAPVVALQLSEHYDSPVFLFLAVAPVVWVALGGDIGLSAIGLLLVNVTITVAAAVWVDETRMSELQVVMLAAALVAMYVAAATFSLARAVERLEDNERRYRAVVDELLQLEQVRWQDPLTGLVNRQRFLDLLTPLGALPQAGHIGVAMVDVDGFKALNDSLGHDGADRVLVEIARRLQAIVGGDGIAARLAADEFAVALPVAGPEDAVAFGELLVRELRQRVPTGDRQVLVTCSVGVATGTSGPSATPVLFDAESALHAAKEGGRDRCATFEAGLRLAAVERASRLSLLQHALEEGEIIVHYQPIVDLLTGTVESVEALVRLRDPAGGLLLPGAFIDLAEEAGLDPALGSLVLEQALRDLAAWPDRPALPPLRVAVNVTSRQLTSPGFVQEVAGACRRHGIEPRRLRLELTETMVMADLDAAARALEALHDLGVSAALDDFGIGYSSMAYLQRFPVDVLKIDRTFVAGLPDDDDDRSIVGLVVGLARALGKEVTAEGIETDEQRLSLLALGCSRGQGFFFARPVDAEEIAARLVREPEAAPT